MKKQILNDLPIWAKFTDCKNLRVFVFYYLTKPNNIMICLLRDTKAMKYLQSINMIFEYKSI